MTTDIIQKAFDDGLEAVDNEALAPAFARVLLDADEIAKDGDPRLGGLLVEFQRLVGDSSDTQKILQAAFGSVEGGRLAKEIVRLTSPDHNASMSKCDGAAVGARARLALSPTVRVAKARGGAAWGATWRAEREERTRQLVLKDLLANHATTRAEYYKTDEGRALYALERMPGGDRLFDEAVDLVENTSPGWIDEQLVKLGRNVAKAGRAVEMIEAKAVAIQKANKDMTIEAARAEAWRRNPDLYKQQRRERVRAAR